MRCPAGYSAPRRSSGWPGSIACDRLARAPHLWVGQPWVQSSRKARSKDARIEQPIRALPDPAHQHRVRQLARLPSPRAFRVVSAAPRRSDRAAARSCSPPHRRLVKEPQDRDREQVAHHRIAEARSGRRQGQQVGELACTGAADERKRGVQGVALRALVKAASWPVGHTTRANKLPPPLTLEPGPEIGAPAGKP
jgi:hypothetical protein